MLKATEEAPSLGRGRKPTPRNVKPAVEFIHLQLGKVRLTVPDLAAQCELTPAQFTYAFQREFGMTPRRYAELLQTYLLIRMMASGVKVRDAGEVLGLLPSRIYRMVKQSTGRHVRDLRQMTPDEAVATAQEDFDVVLQQGSAPFALLRARQRRRGLDTRRRIVRILLKTLRNNQDAPGVPVSRLARTARMRWEYFTRTASALTGMPPRRLIRLQGEPREAMMVRLEELILELT